MRNPLGNALLWLYRGLELQTTEAPSALDTDAVQPVLDVYQGGWAGGTTVYDSKQIIVAGVTGAGTNVTVLTASSNLVRLITAAMFLVDATAAPLDLSVYKRRNVSGLPVYIALGKSLGLVTGTTIPWATLGGGAPWWILEPDLDLIFTNNTALGAADQVRFNFSYIECPRGFKPI